MGGIFLVLLGVFLLAPLGGLLSQVTWPMLTETLQETAFTRALSVTLVSGISASVASVIMGLLFARQFAHHQWFGKRLQRLMLLLPYLVPNFILAIGFVVAWNPTTGLLNTVVRFPGGLY